jgi:hypothetical protein
MCRLITIKNLKYAENYPPQIVVDNNRTGNLLIKNFKLRLLRETIAAVEKQQVLYILSVCL